MQRFIMERFCDHQTMGVFSRLLIGGQEIGFTCEQPWNDNQPFKSCVPAGDYQLIPYHSQKYGKTFALKNLSLGVGVVKGEAQRYACLIHSANVAKQLQGCIAPGEQLGAIAGDWAVIASAKATKQLLERMTERDTLTIIWKGHP
jgi:hypothetical protein